jgi:hypothetical protein
MQASGRTAMQGTASGKPMSTAISEQAEMQPECLRFIFWFKSNNSYSWKQATPTASLNDCSCSLSNYPSKFKCAVPMPLHSKLATLTTKPLRVSYGDGSPTAITNCSFKSITIQTARKPSISSLVKTDDDNQF